MGLGAHSGATSILQVPRGPTVAGANLLLCLWAVGKESLSSGANGNITDSVPPGEPPMVAGEESNLGGKILACKGVRKQPTACFDVLSSASSGSSKTALFK